MTDAPRKAPVPGALAPGSVPAELLAADTHLYPRLLVTAAGAFTSGTAGAVAFVMLALAESHRTGDIFVGMGVFAFFTAAAELVTVASFTADRRMVTWLGWAVMPGHAAGATVCGYLLTTIGAGWNVGAPVAAALAAGLIYSARVGSLRVFEQAERGRRGVLPSARGVEE